MAATAATAPGDRCPCGCNCAVPVNRSPATCPCPCGDCAVCGTRPAAKPKTVGPQPTPTYPAPSRPISVESAVRTPNPRGAATMTAPAPGTVTLTESQLTQLIAAVAQRATPPAPAAPAKPLHEMTSDELTRAIGEAYAPYLQRTGARRIREA